MRLVATASGFLKEAVEARLPIQLSSRSPWVVGFLADLGAAVHRGVGQQW